MLLIPLLVGIIAFAIGRSSPRGSRPPLALAPAATLVAGTPGAPTAPSAPSPLLVLDGFLQRGETPPPTVVMCAIAEAELRGDLDVANEIVHAFILPVVQAADREAAMSARDANTPRGGPPGPYPMMTPPTQTPPREAPAPRTMPPMGAPASPAPGMPGMQAPPRWPPGPEGPLPIARPEDARVEVMPSPSMPVQPRRPVPTAPPPGVISAPEMNAAPRPATLTVSGRSSPITGIPASEWETFAGRVAREQPTFCSNHHVGKYRQRRSRLAELGIDPDSVAGSEDAQAAAFDADMRDAYHHAMESGLVAEYQGHALEIPSSETSSSVRVTLSGVLGVIQAAGLEGAVGWLGNVRDRERFPGTTRAFLRTNGVF